MEEDREVLTAHTETIDEERKRKISDGMKKAHAKRRRLKVINVSMSPKKQESPALRQLIKERDELNVAISALQRRGL